MAILQKVSFFPSERFDTPDARALEAFAGNDWRFFLSGVMSETSTILTGFDIVDYSTVFTVQGFKLKLDNVVFFHPESTTQAAGFYVFAGTEPDENVTLSPSSTNFVELDLEVESGTPDIRAFWDQGANSGEGGEFTDSVETVINLKVNITSNVSGFTAGKIPLYKVVTNASNVATSITDSRSLFFRLGSGGSTPDPSADFSFPAIPDAAHARLETPITATSATATNQPWQGGDKNFKTFKDWMDVVMTSIKEIKGVPYWYMIGSGSGTIPSSYQNAALTVGVSGTWNHLSGSLGHMQLIGGSLIKRLGYVNDLTLSAFADIDLTTDPVLYLLIPTSDTATTYGFGQDGSTPVIPKDITAITPSSITVNTGGNYVTGGGTVMVRGQEFTYTAYSSGTGTFSGVSPDPSGITALTDDVYASDSGGTGYYHVSSVAKVPGLSGTVSEGAERVYWLGVYDGSSVIQLKNGDLELGEQIQVGDNTSLAVLAYMGSAGEADSTPDYLATDTESQPNVAVTNNTDSLTKAVKEVDKTIQSHNAKLVRGGTWTWDLGSTDLTFSADAFISIPGLAEARNRIDFTAESPISLGADGDIAYVDLNRGPGASATLSVSTGTIAGTALTKNRMVIARRIGNDVLVGNGTFLLKGDTTFNESLEIDGALAEINRYFGQLRVTPHESNTDQVRMSGADIQMLDGRILSQEISNLIIDYTGAVVDFSTGTITEDDGATPLGINFTPFAVPVSEYFWYSVTAVSNTVNSDNTVSMQVLIDPASASNAVEASAPKPDFASGKKSAAVLVYNNAGTIEVKKIRQLGVGSGTGGEVLTESTVLNGVSTPADITDFLVDATKNNAFSSEYSILRTEANGEDSAFYTNLGTAFNNFIFVLDVQSDEKILAGGSFTSLNSNTRNLLVRLNSDGTEDTAFYTNLGTGFNISVASIAIQSDGKILVGGGFTTFNGNTRNGLVRLNSDGTEDAAFYTNLGTGFNSSVDTIAIQPDGKILIGGGFTTFNGATRNYMVRLNSSGTEDAAFYTNLGTGFQNDVEDIQLQSDNKIVAGGFFNALNGNTRNHLVRLNTDGTEDVAFYTNLGVGFNNNTTAMSIQSNDKIVIGGSFTSFAGNTRNYMVRLNSDGTEDTDFYGNLGTGFNNNVAIIFAHSFSKIVVGGSFTTLDGNTRNRLVRLNDDGTEDTLFYTSLGTAFSSSNVLALASNLNSKLVVGGGFTSFDGSTRNRMIKLNRGAEIVQQGEIRGVRKVLSSTWEVGAEASFGDDAGIDLTMTAAGQLQYTSDRLFDAPDGTFRFIITRL
jgi:uncharacterized delta-60 repeat protein